MKRNRELEKRIEELIDGAYILKLNIDGKLISKKFIKE